MACNFEQLQRYHDGELDAAASTAVEAHVASCDDCREQVEALRSMSAWVSGATLPSVDTARLDRIASAAWHSADEGQLRKLATWITAAAASIMLLAMLNLSSQPKDSTSIVATDVTTAPSYASMPVSSAEWERAAVTPISTATLSADESNRDLVQFAQWMATDLDSK